MKLTKNSIQQDGSAVAILSAQKQARGQIKKRLANGRVAEADRLFQQTNWHGLESRNVGLMWNLVAKTKLTPEVKQWLQEHQSLQNWLESEHRVDRNANLRRLWHIANHNFDLFAEVCHDPKCHPWHFEAFCVALQLKTNKTEQMTILGEIWEKLLSPIRKQQVQQVPNLKFLLGIAIAAENEIAIDWLLTKQRQHLMEVGKEIKGPTLQMDQADLDFDFLFGGLRSITKTKLNATQIVTALQRVPVEKINWQYMDLLLNLKTPEVVGEVKARLQKMDLDKRLDPAMEQNNQTITPRL